MLSLNEKIKILNLLKSGMTLTKVGCKVSKNKSSIRTISQEEAEIRGSISASPTVVKMVSLVHDKVLAKAEKALSVWLEDMLQKDIPVDGKIMHEKTLYCEGLRRMTGKRLRLARDGWLAM